jgi:hypothetical protein
MKDKIDIENFVEKIAKVEPVAVTVSKCGVQEGIIILTIYGVDEEGVPDEISQASEVSVRGVSTQLMMEYTHDGLNTMDGILLHGSEDIVPDCCEIDVGFSTLYNEFEDYAGEQAATELNEILQDYCEGVDTRLLREVAAHTEPAVSFSSPSGDSLIEAYQIDGHTYYLYTDGGVYEAYRGSGLSPTTTEMFRDSRYWQSTSEAISKRSTPA